MEGVESDRETVARYNTLRQELQNLADKIAELEMDADEHKLVIGALSPLPPSRKCWRRVGGVLVEETVGQTLPVLNTNLSGVLVGTSKCTNTIDRLKKLPRGFGKPGKKRMQSCTSWSAKSYPRERPSRPPPL